MDDSDPQRTQRSSPEREVGTPLEKHYTRSEAVSAAVAEARRRGHVPGQGVLGSDAQGREESGDEGLRRQHYANAYYEGHTSHAVAGYVIVAAISVLGGVLVALLNGGL